MKRLTLTTLISLITLMIGVAVPVHALELTPQRDEPPALSPGQAVEGQLLVKFSSAPTITYESEIAIPIPFTGRRITLRNEGLAVRGLPGATSVTKGLRIQSMKVLGDGGVANQVALAQLPEGVDVADAAAQYRKQRGVDAAEPNYLFSSFWVPNDNYFIRNANQDYQWNFHSIRMPEAWDVSPRGGSPSVKVAVIDSGVAFEDNGIFTIASELDHIPFVSPRRFESLSGDCTTSLPNPIVDTHPNDSSGHGTHVTGTIAQKTNNWMSEASNGLAAGMAHNVSIIPIKVLTRCTTGPDAGTSLGALSDIIAGVGYATLVGADVINMSLGGPSDSTLLHLAITTAVNAGVTVVASSGNDALRTSSPPIGFPAAYPEVIAVGATRFDGKRAEYSQYGPELDLVAPGGQLWADDSPEVQQCLGSQPTIPGKVACLILDQNNDKLPDGIVQQTILPDIPNQFTGVPVSPSLISQFRCVEVDTQQGVVWISDECGNFNGTSMSSPHVAAAAALILSVNPNLTPAQVKDILTSTASKTAIPDYTQTEHGAGQLDVMAALLAASGGTITPPVSSPTPTVTPGGLTSTPTPTQESLVACKKLAAGFFVEKDGQIVMEAEHCNIQNERSGKAWTIRATPTGFVSDGLISAEPDTGSAINTGYGTSSPETVYHAQFATGGVYYVWARGYAMTANDNSVHLGLNHVETSSAAQISLGTSGSWVWSNTTNGGQVATINVTDASLPDIHDISIWMDEDGFKLDRILLTKDASFTPIGDGPPESFRSGWTTSEPFQLLVGDVNDDNKITIFDVGAVISKYTDFKVPVAVGTPEDVNADGFMTIADVALVLLNYTDFSIPGDSP